MQKIIILFIVLSTLLSCSETDDSDMDNQIDQSLIDGWWYPGVDAGFVYKGYYFGDNDGVYKQDMTNFSAGIGEGTWVWLNDNTLEMTPTPGGGIIDGVRELTILKLTQDSLVFQSPSLKLSRTDHSD